MKKRVLHVIPSISPKHGGPTVAILEMVAAQREAGINSVILTSDDDNGQGLDVKKYKWVRKNSIPILYIPRVKSSNHTLIGFTFAPGFICWFYRFIKRFQFVHFHTVFSFPVNVGMFFAMIARVPFAVRPLGQLCKWSLGQRSIIKKIQLLLFTSFFIKRSRFIHVTSNMERIESAVAIPSKNYLVLPHGVSAPKTYDNSRSLFLREIARPDFTGVIILFLSRIHQKKGIEELISAVEGLTFPFLLVVAGDGDSDYVLRIKDLAKKGSKYGSILFVGHVHGARKEILLGATDIFVLPSYSENFGIAAAEAIARDIPVVVTDNVALSEEVKKSRCGEVIRLSIDALYETLVKLGSNKLLRDEYSKNCCKLVALYLSWQRNTEILRENYFEK